MRLIKLDDYASFSLVEFAEDEVPHYAILSHTWERDIDEVTYKDIIENTGSGKSGYNKLNFCAVQARNDGLDYCWIDTCCIDKTNAAELTESINSMFRWYKNATKCYVYLSDVLLTDNSSSTSEEDKHSQIQKSRWFTRGWTLQELIAPRTVEFFSQKHERLGDRKSLENQICQVSGISIYALRGEPLSRFPVDERMSWAANRHTKRPEDKVYSLLGIFDIHMEAIYGEGEYHASQRLLRELERYSENHQLNTLFQNQLYVTSANIEPAKMPLVNSTWIVPFERNFRFTGREPELTRLEDMLFGKHRAAKLAITGLGGVGKTQLVIELLYRVADRQKDCSVIWISAVSRESVHQSFLDVARQLRVPGCDDDKKDVKKLVQEHLSKESAGKWLMVFDNADDMDMWISKPGSGQVSHPLIDYVPKSKEGAVLFTTRDKKIAVKLAQPNVVDLTEMREDAAAQLLRKCLVNADLAANPQETSTLLSQLTYLPLAIVQAAAYINENSISVAEYLLLLAEQEEEVIDLLSEEFEDDGRYRDIKNPVATTWLISFDQMQRRDRLAADYLSFMACTASKGIPLSLLPPGASRKKEVDAIGTLIAYSFVNKNLTDESLDLHRLVHLATRNWLRREGLLAQSTERAILRLGEVFPDHEHQHRMVWRKYLTHASYALESSVSGDESEPRNTLLWKLGMCLYQEGRWNEAERVLLQVKETRERDLGTEHPDTLVSMTNLASTYRHQGRWKEAEELEIQVIRTRKRLFGEEHPDTLHSIAGLAATYRRQGRWKEAEELEVQVMERSIRLLGEEHPDTLTSMASLASTYRDQGRWKEAERLEVEVLKASSRVLGKEHPATLTSMSNLASTYRDQGRWKEAEELEVEVLKMSSRVLGEEHPDTLSSMANLAWTYWNQGRWDAAEELELQVMETRKTKLGPDHPDTLSGMGNLASTYLDQGRWDMAEELFVQVMETRKRKLGADHPDTLSSMGNLALTYRSQARWSMAEELFVELIETCKTKLGPDHPDTLTGMANLASTYSSRGEWKAAEELEVDVLEFRKLKLGPDHPDTLTSIANLASTYSSQGRWDAAEELEVQVIETRKTKLGPDHPDTLTSMANLASTYSSRGQWDAAEELEVQVLEIRKMKLGPDHPDTLTSMANLASTYSSQDRWGAAEELEVQVLEIRKEKLGPDHPDTLSGMANLGMTYRNQGRYDKAEELELQVLEARKRTLGVDHPDTFSSMGNLASTYRYQNRLDAAEELEIQVMENRKRVLGVDHLDTLTSMANLASTYWNQGRWDAAEEIEVQVLETRKTKIGEDHPDTLTSMGNLASTYWNQGRWDAAEELEVKVLEARRKKLGEESPATLTTMANLAFTIRSQGRHREALALMQRCSEMRKRILGSSHPDTKNSLKSLELWEEPT